MNVPDAAVGNGVVDARTALDNRTDPEARRWSEAFEYGVLDRLDDAWLDGGQDILDAEAHATWFADSAAGYAWSAVDRPDSGVSPNSGIPEEIASEQQIVEQLNKDQRAYDDALRDLAIARERLHALWWLAGLSDDELEDRKAPADFRARVKEQLDPDFAGSLAGQVGDLVFRCVGDETTTGLRDAVPQGATPDELARSIAAYEAKVKLPPARTLRRTPLPPYRRGTDPLTLLRGDGMRVDLPSTAPVPVRAATRLIAKMTGANPITPPIPVPTPNGYEALKKALSWAPLEAAVAEFWTLAEAAARINDTPSVEPDKSFDAALERLGFTPGDAESGKTTTGWFTRLWRQYWAPMYLWWQAHCYPLHYDSGGTKYWTFDGRRHCWTGGEAPGAKFVEGRSLLTGAPPFALAGRVDQYINTLADPYGEVAAKLRKMLAERENRDQVAQGLAGLDPWFAERDQANHFDPFDGTSAALLTPQPTVALPGKGQYQPIRAGQLYFEKLVVVDRFGRGVDLVRGNPDAFRPRRSRDVKPDLDSKGVPLTVESENRDRFVQFRPRLAQPARTLLELVHSRDDDVALRPWDSPRYAGAPDPICGWLVPDRGGRSLFVLAADGTGIGELLVTDDPDGPRVAWLPLPGSTVLTIDQLLSPEFAEAHPHLGPLLSGVLTRTDAAAALNDLIATIDTALQTIAPPANHSPAYRSVFTGLPLAVVRARLRIELSGPPIYAAEWKRILAGPDTDDGNPLRTIRWQVRLGDPWRRTDGLIGFCRPRAPEKAHDTDYNTLFIPHSHALSESDYLQPTDGLSDPVVVATEPPAEVEHSRPATGEPGAAWITALVAPWAPVHAYTGVLPVTTAQVPEAFLSDPLARMSVFLRTGPLPAGLRSPGPDLPEGIALPVPTGTRGTWAWSERTEPDALYPWADYTFAGTETAVRPPDEPPVARTGYLRFTPNPVGDAGPTPINREGRQP
ncbi:hypothetical protein [Saccharopolyspora spinosa]|nr:hypothetical protein [Saccharopolyspora spinosa]